MNVIKSNYVLCFGQASLSAKYFFAIFRTRTFCMNYAVGCIDHRADLNIASFSYEYCYS